MNEHSWDRSFTIDKSQLQRKFLAELQLELFLKKDGVKSTITSVTVTQKMCFRTSFGLIHIDFQEVRWNWLFINILKRKVTDRDVKYKYVLEGKWLGKD